MKKLKSIFLFFVIISICISTIALPQSKAKAKETVKVVTNLMKKCVNHNWMLYDIRFNGKPFMNYNVIFNENASGKLDPSALGKKDQYFTGDFGLDPRSELSKKLIDPLDNEFIRMSSEKPEPQDSMNAITKKEKEIGGYYVYVFFNKKNIEGKQFTGVKIPGAALVTMTNHSFRDSCNWNSYFIGFGNWKDASKSTAGYTYKFKKHSGSQYVDNVVVVMTGLKNRMQELLKGVKWGELNKLIDN